MTTTGTRARDLLALAGYTNLDASSWPEYVALLGDPEHGAIAYNLNGRSPAWVNNLMENQPDGPIVLRAVLYQMLRLRGCGATRVQVVREVDSALDAWRFGPN